MFERNKFKRKFGIWVNLHSTDKKRIEDMCDYIEANTYDEMEVQRRVDAVIAKRIEKAIVTERSNCKTVYKNSITALEANLQNKTIECQNLETVKENLKEALRNIETWNNEKHGELATKINDALIL